MKLTFQSLLILSVCAGCQTPTTVTPLSQEERIVAIDAMAPDFECVRFHDQAGNKDGVAKSIDDAVTIGEEHGMPGGEIMAVYGKIRKEQEGIVLERAIEIASKREGLIPRISGEPSPPNAEEETQAWRELYAEGCETTS